MKPILRCLNLLSFSLFFLLALPPITLCAHSSTPPSAQAVLREVQILKASVPPDLMDHEISIAEYNLYDLLIRIIANDPETPFQVRACAAKLEHGTVTLSLGELLKIFPEIVKFAYDNWDSHDVELSITRATTHEDDHKDKAIRPSIITTYAPSDEVVGKNGCDLTQILAILSVIRKCVKELKQIVCEKFAETWTILADIKETMTEVFFDTSTILCDKFNGTFTVLAEIEQEIFDTRTILCDKFSGTFTELSRIYHDLFDTRTILCDKFNSTFTELESEFSEVFTALGFICEKIESITAPLACFQELPISAPTIITNPGSYCLVNDIVGTVTIAANCVTLNLNGFKFLGTEVHISTSDNTDIVIKNGSIQGSATNGIAVNNSINVELVNLNLVDNSVGVFIASTTCLKVAHCTFRGHTTHAIQTNNLFNGRFSNLTCKNNTGAEVVQLTQNHNIKFDNIAINNNTNSSGLFRPIFVDQSTNMVFKHVSVNENVNGQAMLLGIHFANSNNLKLQNSQVHGNTAPVVTAVFFASGCTDATVESCEVNRNTSLQSDFVGIFADNTVKLVLKDSQVNNNIGQLVTNGFSVENCTDIIAQNCFALTNSSSAATTAGFRGSNCTKIIWQDCIANDNISTLTATGFDFRNTGSSCIIDCIAKRNTSVTQRGQGIFLLDCQLCVVENNLVSANNGPLGNVGIGVVNTGGLGLLTTAVISNKSQDISDNYLVSPGDIPRAGLRFSNGTFTPALPTPFDNLFTQQAP